MELQSILDAGKACNDNSTSTKSVAQAPSLSHKHHQDLTNLVRTVRQDLRRVAEEELGKVEAQLEGETRDDARLRELHAGRWQRPASAALNSTMREKVAGYRCAGGPFAPPSGRLCEVPVVPMYENYHLNASASV